MCSRFRYVELTERKSLLRRCAHILHAITSTFLVARSLRNTSEFAWDDGTSPYDVLSATSTFSHTTFCFSIGYFVADMVLMKLTDLISPPMILHHVVGVGSLATALGSGRCHLYGLLLLSTEVTTPFICMRWLLEKANRRGAFLATDDIHDLWSFYNHNVEK